MKLNDYKEALGALHTPAGLRERVLKNCMNGEEPKEFEDGRRSFDKVKRVISVAATFAVIVIVAVAMVMLTRFIGPETPQGPGGDLGSLETPPGADEDPKFPETEIEGFRLISVESTLYGLSAQIDSFDNASKTLAMSWVNNSGKDLRLGREYSFYKLEGETWSTDSFEKLNTIFWEEDLREFPSGTECSNYGVVGSLTKWSDSLTAGIYKIEKKFFGDTQYQVTITFELTSDKVIRGFKLISVESTLDGLTARINSYDISTKSLDVTWVNNSGKALMFGREYSLTKYEGETWSANSFEKTLYWKQDAHNFSNGMECFDYGGIGSLTKWSDNITSGIYKVEKEFWRDGDRYTVTIIFELFEEEDTSDTSDTNDTGDNNVPNEDDNSIIMISDLEIFQIYEDSPTGYLIRYFDNKLEIGWDVDISSSKQLMYYGEYSVYKYEGAEHLEPILPLEKFEEGLLLENGATVTFDFDYWFSNEIAPGKYKLKLKCILLEDGSEHSITINFIANEVLQEELYYVKSLSGDCYEVAGIGAVISNEVEIRSTYKGLPVKIIQPQAFKNCTNITKIKMSDTIERIEAYAFQGCTNLESVEFSKKVWMIEDYAFQGCSSLKNIVLPNSVKSIGDGVFSYCENIESLIVEEGSENYFSKGNCIFHTIDNKTTLIAGCKNSYISFEDSITHIGTSAFEGITALTSLNLPKTLIDVGASAFRDCHNLQITYNGTVEAWYSIRRVGSEENGYPKITVICTDGTARCYGRDDA